MNDACARSLAARREYIVVECEPARGGPPRWLVGQDIAGVGDWFDESASGAEFAAASLAEQIHRLKAEVARLRRADAMHGGGGLLGAEVVRMG